MATYTVAQLKNLTGVAAVATMSDERILLYQSTAEAILAGLDLDTTMTGYQGAYDSAVALLFDYVAENPTGQKANQKGKVSAQFADSLPAAVQTLLKPYIEGSGRTMNGARLIRRDIGLR